MTNTLKFSAQEESWKTNCFSGGEVTKKEYAQQKIKDVYFRSVAFFICVGYHTGEAPWTQISVEVGVKVMTSLSLVLTLCSVLNFRKKANTFDGVSL